MIIGITGKSGTGKSTIANALSNELDGVVICFDKISHLTTEKESFKTLVREKISPNVFDSNGNIIRKKLGEIVFSDTEKLNLINNHSEQMMNIIIDELIKTCDKKYIILDYALLPRMKYFNACDFKILVTASDATRFDRILNRDGTSEEYAKKRDANSPNYIPALFDVVIENNTNEECAVDNIVKLIKNKENLC